MANDAAAHAQPPGTPSEDEYQTFCAALSASARGRAFLAEYARRHRGADTATLLAALARLEALMRARAEPARAELRKLLAIIAAARPELEQSPLPTRAAKLAALLDLLVRRLEALAAVEPQAEPSAETARLAVVPPPDEPELPIPTPSAAQPPALTLAHERAPPPLPAAALTRSAASAAIIPEVTWFDGTAPVAAAAELVSAPPPAPPGAPTIVEKAQVTAPAPAEAAMPTPASEAKLPEPPPHPLAALLALSEEERIALFT